MPQYDFDDQPRIDFCKLPDSETIYALGCTSIEAQTIRSELQTELNNKPTLKYHLVELNIDGSVKLQSSTLIHSTILANLTNPHTIDELDIIWELAPDSETFMRFHAPAIGVTEVNNGNVLFCTCIQYGPIYPVYMMFTLDSNNVLTTTAIMNYESSANKVQNIATNSTSTSLYPSTSAVFNEFQRKPVVVWEVAEGQTGILSSEQDITATPKWQLENLDMTAYKRIKIYTKSGRKSSGVGVDASNTPGVVLEMSLDDRAASPVGGHFMGSIVGQKPNDANRLYTVTCAVSSDKTKFAVLRMTTLYGTAATANSDCNGYVFLIEGYYD